MNVIHATKAKDAAAIGFLLHLGFTEPKVTESGSNRIALTYESMDPDKIKRELGNPLPNLSPEFYNFGTTGKVIVNQKTKQVVLLNIAKNSLNPSPIRTHVPEGTSEAPAVAPRILPKLITPVNKPKITVDDPSKVNLPGSHDNDDNKVPHVPLTEALEQDYISARVNGSTGAQISFINKLYTYLNKLKFKDQLQKPQLGLLKNVASDKLRLRGVWYPTQRRLCLSPRLFNAHISFFTEILLHEICHQAVTEIDRVHDRTAQGHGPNWQHWMIKVGLNPRRFDPNDNSTYMSISEKQEHENKKSELKNNLAGLNKYSLYQYTGPIPVTKVVKGEALNGMLFRDNRGYWFVSDEQKEEGGTRAWKVQDDKGLYQYGGDNIENYDNPAWKYVLKKWKAF